MSKERIKKLRLAMMDQLTTGGAPRSREEGASGIYAGFKMLFT